MVMVIVISSARQRAQIKAAVNDVAAGGVIHIGLRGDIGTLCSFDEQTQTFEGFEKDIVDEMIHRLFGQDILVEYLPVTSETKDALLVNGDIDIALGASIRGTTSGITYTSPYFSDGAAFLVKEGDMASEQGLDGGTVAIVQGSYAERKGTDYDTKMADYLAEHGIDAEIVIYASYQEAIEALELGFADGICANEIFLKIYGKSGMLMLPERFMPHPYCVEVSATLGMFGDAVENTVLEMKNDGTIETLVRKWDLFDYALLKE